MALISAYDPTDRYLFILAALAAISLLIGFGVSINDNYKAQEETERLTEDMIALEDTRNDLVLELEAAGQPIHFDLSDPVPLQGDVYDNIDQLEQTKRQLEQDIKRLELIQAQNQ